MVEKKLKAFLYFIITYNREDTLNLFWRTLYMNDGFLTLVEEQSNLDPIMYQYFNHYKNHRTID